MDLSRCVLSVGRSTGTAEVIETTIHTALGPAVRTAGGSSLWDQR